MPYIRSGRISAKKPFLLLGYISTAWIFSRILKMPVYTIKDLVEATQIQVIVKPSW